jgi:hypothetical protein
MSPSDIMSFGMLCIGMSGHGAKNQCLTGAWQMTWGSPGVPKNHFSFCTIIRRREIRSYLHDLGHLHQILHQQEAG